MDDVIFIAPGSTDVTLQVKLRDIYTGALKTGVTVTNLDLYYIRVEDDNDVTVSAKADLSLHGSLTAVHSDNHAIEIGYGYYRVDLPDEAFAIGAFSVSLVIGDGSATPVILMSTVDVQLGSLGALTQQQVRDAMKLAPTGNSPAVGSIDKQLDDVEIDTNEVQTKLPTNNIIGSSDKANHDTVIAAVKAKTDLIPASPAAVGSEMNLADAAITKAKYNETDAYPVLSADAGSSQIARKGADAQTLSTLDALIDTVKVDTAKIPASPAAVGSAMTLAADAITAVAHDETTAFPIKAADASDTQLARKGSGAHTLTTLKTGQAATKLASDGLDAVSAAEPGAVPMSMNFREKLLAVFMFMCGKTWHHKTAPGQGEFKQYKEDESTVLYKQPTADDGTDQTKGEAIAP